MEKVLPNEWARVMIILGMGVVGLSALVIKMISNLKGSFKPFKKPVLWYLLFSMVAFALIAFMAHPFVFTEPLSFLIFSQCYFFLFGLVHYHLMHHYLHWSGEQNSFTTELLFTLVLALIGTICFLLVFWFVYEKSMAGIMAGSICFFIIPIFIYQVFEKAVEIPQKIFKTWVYPFNEIGEPDEGKMKNLLVISFEFQKQEGDTHLTNFRAKAPADMEFGQLFYYFINDYNERHPNSPIQYLHNNSEPHEWIFYKKNGWLKFLKQYIDSGKTIFSNKIRENDVVYCERAVS